MIWKYRLQREIYMPEGAKILSVQLQGDDICLWAEVNENKMMVLREFEIVGTGYAPPTTGKYVATVQQGSFVWHIYEVTK